ncbi:hypothetical protein MMC26_001017 [Xylographa opegraphella]|nr:hypothetical protein [Xylographa opegraphella]
MAQADATFSPDLPPGGIEQDGSCTRKSLLKDLIAQATAKYAVKDYNTAAELYSQATELQAEMNGEMSSQNADLLYSYGRCLYHVAVSNSDVLGSKVAGEKREEAQGPAKSKWTEGRTEKYDERHGDEREAKELVSAMAIEKTGQLLIDNGKPERKPYFAFTGDENFDDSDEDEEEVGGEEGAAEAEVEEDDFSNAYEVLDLARLLLQRKLKVAAASEVIGSTDGDSADVKQLKERLADTYDLQAEISLEGERFPNAVVDLRAALQLKEELFPQDSSLIAEAHYKLSLALEFSSVTQQKDENGEVEANQTAHIDETMRQEAAIEMEAAIKSCKVRIEREEAALASGISTNCNSKKSKVTKASIDDVREMVKDMEQRLVELRQPPVSINDPRGTGSVDGTIPFSGILGSILGESPESQRARIEEASQVAQDLTKLVRRKKPVQGDAESASAVTSTGLGKRKLDDLEEETRAKKTKSEDR